jgi:hypothetical protein
MSEESFPKEVAEFLLQYASDMYAEYPSHSTPDNLSLARFETAMYLCARTEALFEQMKVDPEFRSSFEKGLDEILEKEFRIQGNDRLERAARRRKEQYRELGEKKKPFTQKWYESVFIFFAARLTYVYDENRHLTFAVEPDPPPQRNTNGISVDVIELINRLEIEKVFEFQRLVVGFFNSQPWDD